VLVVVDGEPDTLAVADAAMLAVDATPLPFHAHTVMS
jgi:hypothetical protein